MGICQKKKDPKHAEVGLLKEKDLVSRVKKETGEEVESVKQKLAKEIE